MEARTAEERGRRVRYVTPYLSYYWEGRQERVVRRKYMR